MQATADLEIGLLIYNAGADPNMARFLDKPLDVWQAMLTRNCATVMASAHHFGGLMAKRGHGGVVLVTSGAAWAGGSRLAVYGASKAFDLILAESLWAELEPSGVHVSGDGAGADGHAGPAHPARGARSRRTRRS